MYPDPTIFSQEEYEKAVVAHSQTWADHYRRAGEPVKAKVLPTGRTSRWTQHYGDRLGGQPKPVTLTANATSMVRVS